VRFLVAVLDNGTATAVPGEMQAIDAFNDMLRKNGHWVLAAGLVAPENATVIDNRGDVPRVTTGAFNETEVYMSGFWIIEAPDTATAHALAAEGSMCCNRAVEVRQFLGG
jgi:hypothetical protein